MTDTRLTLRQAAAALGVSESAVRKRVERGTLRSDKGADGKRYVYLPAVADTVADEGADPSATSERDALISEMRARIESLEHQLSEANTRDEEQRRVILALTSRIPAIEASSDAPGGRQESDRTEGRGDVPDDQETPVQRPWWRRVFGG